MHRWLSLGILLLAGTAWAGQSGRTGFALLRMNSGARTAALAGAGTASAVDASAALANPAGLPALRGSEVYLAHEEWLQGIDHDLLAVAIVGRNSAWALSLAHLAVGDIELRTMPSTEPLASVSAHEVVLGLSHARQVHERLRLGITAKYLYDKIYLDTAGGLAVDVGALYETGWYGLTCGAAVRNLGATGRLRDERVALPYQVQAGLSRQVDLPALQSKLLVVADVLFERGESAKLLLAMEGLLRDIVAVRLGYAAGYDSRGLSFGIGLASGRYRLDYAYTPFENDLGNAQQVSLSIGLSKR
ncbi:MAG: PorV/PorQ family protein [Calditrichaeota bacterium]|nr:PorV/PorQ family protein [Calditrichota bacterium]